MICKFLPDLAHANRDKVIEAVPKLHGKIVRPIQPDGFGERAGALLRFSTCPRAQILSDTSSNSELLSSEAASATDYA